MSATKTSAWPPVRLGDIGQSLIGLTYSPSDVSQFGTLVLRSSNIQDGRLTFDDNVYVSSPIPDRIKVREGDVLICVRNGSRRLIGKSVMLDHRVAGQTFGAFMAVYRSPYNKFLQYFFESDGFKRQVDAHLGATINQITNASLNSFVVALPAPAEQDAIASRLSDADRYIATLKRLIAKKQAIKRGMMQQLHTGRTRLPGFSGEWIARRLRDHGSTYGGLTGKTKEDFGVGQARFVTFLDVIYNTRIITPNLEQVVVRRTERQNQVLRGDVLFNGSSETPEEVALSAVVDFDPKPSTYLNSFCFGYRLRDGVAIHPAFLAYFFRASPGRALVASLAQGATRYNIAKTKFLELAPVLPPVAEQAAVASVLHDADDEIAALKVRLEKTQAVKQGMMQQLLTGRTRLPVQGAAV